VRWFITDTDRPISWRWERAIYIAESPQYADDDDDSYILRAGSFLRGLRRLDNCRSTEEVNNRRRQLRETYPVTDKAYLLYQGESDIRWVVEAALLAKSTYKRLSELTGLPPKVLSTYARLFFDIKDRLKYPMLVSSLVFAPIVRDGFQSRERNYLWKRLGYLCGLDFLEGFLGSSTLSAQHVREVDRQYTDEVRRAALASVMSPVADLANDVHREYNALLNRELSTQESGGGATESTQAYTHVIEAIGISAPYLLRAGPQAPVELPGPQVIKRLSDPGKVAITIDVES